MRAPVVRTRRWTRKEYGRLIDIGFFEEPQNTPHATACDLAGDALRAAFGTGWRVRMGLPMGMDPDSAPEPAAPATRVMRQRTWPVPARLSRRSPRRTRASRSPDCWREGPRNGPSHSPALGSAPAKPWRSSITLPGHLAAGITTTNSPRGGVARSRSRWVAAGARTISSNCLVSSRATTISASPKTSAIASSAATMRCGDS